MSKYIRIIYLYIVSFITLGMLVGGIISFVNSVTEYFYPTDYIFFREENVDKYDYKEYSLIDESETQIEKENARIRQIKEIATNTAIIVVAIPLYIYHWKKVQTERIEGGEE